MNDRSLIIKSMVDLEKAAHKIALFYREQHRMPSFSEVATLFNYASKMAAHRLIEKLKKAGYLNKDRRGKLIPTSKIALPLLGSVQAGFPSPAEELADVLSLDEYLVRNPEKSFMLKVSGDSMIDAGIHAGDLVIIEKENSPRNGSIVLAHIDNEWTLKYFYKTKDKVFLRAANPKYPDLFPGQELTCGGIVTAVVRRYDRSH